MRTASLKFTGIGRKMVLSFAILIFVVIVFQQLTTYYLIHFTVQDINKNYIKTGLIQKNEKLTKFVGDLDLFSKAIISNREIQALLAADRDAGDSLNKFNPEVSYAISNEIEGFFLVSKSGKVYQEAEIELGEYVNSRLPGIIRAIGSSRGEMRFFRSEFIKYGANHRDYFFLVARKIRDLNFFRDIGIIVLAVRESKLWDSISMEGDLGESFVIAADGRIISARPQKMIGLNIATEKPYREFFRGHGLERSEGSYIRNRLVNYVTNEATRWKLLSIVSINDLNKNYANVQIFLLLIGVVAIIGAIWLSVIISGKITNPIRELAYSMKKVMAGNLDVRATAAPAKDSVDEIEELNDVFNQMTEELQYLIEEVYQENLREKEAELRALKAQINPHFLYNTLDTIYWMLILKGDEETSVLITKLGEILRYSIKKGSSNVTVREEIQQVENYLFIQKARFEESLTYELRLDEAIMEYEILSFVIQPFIENAVNHGITNGKGSGRIILRGYQEGSSLLFEISDDGAGMTEAQLLEIRRQQNAPEMQHKGIGIANVHNRIKYFYGAAYGVVIASRPEGGTQVTIKLPAIISSKAIG